MNDVGEFMEDNFGDRPFFTLFPRKREPVLLPTKWTPDHVRGDGLGMVQWIISSCHRYNFLGLFFVAFICVWFAATASAQEKSLLMVETKAGPKHSFFVELAQTPEQQAKGLMFREQLPMNAGMLFLYPQPQGVAFWMKNTPLSLDIIFVAPGGKILNIAANTTPMSEAAIPSAGPVVAVLEINAGLSAKLGIAPGDVIRHPKIGR